MDQRYRDEAYRLLTADGQRGSLGDDLGACAELLGTALERGDRFRARVAQLLAERGSTSRNPHDPVYQEVLRQASDEEYR